MTSYPKLSDLEWIMISSQPSLAWTPPALQSATTTFAPSFPSALWPATRTSTTPIPPTTYETASVPSVAYDRETSASPFPSAPRPAAFNAKPPLPKNPGPSVTLPAGRRSGRYCNVCRYCDAVLSSPRKMTDHRRSCLK